MLFSLAIMGAVSDSDSDYELWLPFRRASKCTKRLKEKACEADDVFAPIARITEPYKRDEANDWRRFQYESSRMKAYREVVYTTPSKLDLTAIPLVC